MLGALYHKINIIALITIAFFIPVTPKVLPLLILICGLNWLILQNFKEKFLHLKKNYKGIIFLTSLFLLYLLSMLYTNNNKAGWFDIEVKLSLLLFPFFFLTTPALKKHQTENIFMAFVMGCSTAVVLSFIHAFRLFTETGAISAFVYTNFSFLFHPTYYALYLNFAIIILFGFLFEKEKKYKYEKLFYISLIILFSGSIILSNSKAVIFTLLLTLLIGAVFYGYRKGFLKLTLLVTLIFIGIMAFVVYKTPVLFNRISDSKRIVTNFFNHEKLKDYEGTSQRILVWRSSIKIIKENFWFGVGAGDVKDKLMDDYRHNNYKYILAKQLNSHNQFLQTFIATGIFGILLLLLLFVFPFIKSIKSKDFVYFSFLLLVCINFFTESMLEKQAGVVFFAFFNSILYTLNSPEKQEITLPSPRNP